MSSGDTFCQTLAKMARTQFIRNVFKYRITDMQYDIILDQKGYSIVTLMTEPGMIVFTQYNKDDIDLPPDTYSAIMYSGGERFLIDEFPLNWQMPSGGKPNLTIIK